MYKNLFLNGRMLHIIKKEKKYDIETFTNFSL